MVSITAHPPAKITHRVNCRAVIRLYSRVAGGKLPSPHMRWIYAIHLSCEAEEGAERGGTELISSRIALTDPTKRSQTKRQPRGV